MRPALDRLRDLVAQVPVEVVVVYAPDRLARRYAYQALLIEEFARAGTEVRFVKAPSGDTPEDRLLVQFQGMIAEYERAQIAERTRWGKLHRARAGSVNVLGGAPYGYRYINKTPDADARYEIAEHQAAVVRDIFARYVDGQDSIAGLCRWLEGEGIPTATGKRRWDRSTVWGMLRNPAYAGRAGFGKTARRHDARRHDARPTVTRSTRLAGKARATNPVTIDCDPTEWIDIAVPAVIDQTVVERAARRLDDNKRFAARNTTTPALLKGNGGPGNNACSKGCVTDPQHSFYCVGEYYGSRHRTCGEERRTYDNKYVASFRIRKFECAGNTDGWRWELRPNDCGCSGGKVKRTSCNDGYYNLRPVGGDPNKWGPDHTSVCRYHSNCVTPLGN